MTDLTFDMGLLEVRGAQNQVRKLRINPSGSGQLLVALLADTADVGLEVCDGLKKANVNINVFDTFVTQTA